MNTEHPGHESQFQPLPNGTILRILALYAIAFIGFGFVMSTAREIVDGLIDILTVRDTLITDYIGVGGMGAAFVNAGLLMLVACMIYHLAGARITGASTACLFLLLGFGLFGKNLLNVWLIVIGVFLYARLRKESFAAHIDVAFFGCALAPVVSEILFSTSIPLTVSAPLAVLTGLVLGFVLPPAAEQLFKAHMGFNLYNIGFTAGVVGVLIVALYKSYGFVPDPVMIWTSGNNDTLATFLLLLFISMILGSLYLDRRAISAMAAILKSSGQAPTDYISANISAAGFGAALLNMGLCGLIGLAYVLVVGADLNGPTIGGIFTIVGFAAFGKHPGNIVPIMLGVFMGSLAKPWDVSDAAIVLAALFGTTLAPIAGRFGWHWGIVAGFVHSSAALSVGGVHAGLNLYNNGFAAGMVAAVLVPVIIAVTPGGRHDDQCWGAGSRYNTVFACASR
jgi:hypothetical protein